MYSGQTIPRADYDRQIKYLDYMENGQRSRGAGFVKLEKRDGRCNVTLQISGLYRKDHFTRPFLLYDGMEERELCKLHLADGGVKTYLENLDSHSMDGQGLEYELLQGLRIPISEGKEIRCLWENKKVTRVSKTKNEPIGEAERQREKEKEGLVEGQKEKEKDELIGAMNGSAEKEKDELIEATKNLEEKEKEEPIEETASQTARQTEKADPTLGIEAEVLAEAARETVRNLATEVVRENMAEVISDTPPAEMWENVAEVISDTPPVEMRENMAEVISDTSPAEMRENVAEVKSDTPQTEMREALSERDNAGSEKTLREMQKNEREDVEQVSFQEDKWSQLWSIYPHIHPFSDEREYLSFGLSDLVVLPERYYRLVHNSFLLHGYYTHQYLILTNVNTRNGVRYYIGVPGYLFEKEKKIAVMFGFEHFECAADSATEGDFGYYLIPVEL